MVSKWLEEGSHEFEFLDGCVWRKITATWQPSWFEDATRADRDGILKRDCYDLRMCVWQVPTNPSLHHLHPQNTAFSTFGDDDILRPLVHGTTGILAHAHRRADCVCDGRGQRQRAGCAYPSLRAGRGMTSEDSAKCVNAG